jgi:iron complex outermembrane receptor protein
VPVPVGGPLPRSPNHRLSLTGTYTLPLDKSIGRISVGVTYVYTSSQVTDVSSILSPIPATNLVNLNLDWKSIGGLPVDLGVFVTNLTKEEDYLNTANSWASLGFEQVVTNQPRMFGVRVKYRFGQ